MPVIHTWQYLASITTFDGDTGYTLSSINGGSTPSSGAWPAANDALFIPITIKQSVRVKRIYWWNGNSVSGNLDVGVYTKAGGRIISSGSIAQTGGGTALQFYNPTDFNLSAGIYYLAMAMNNTTGTQLRQNAGVNNMICLGCAKQASAFALPATATFATVTASYLPFIGLEIGTIT